MQQARIVYDHADTISRFTTQWAVYCFFTCLRVTPCYYSIDQKAARRELVAVLSGLSANTKDIYLVPLVKEHVTIDAAMEQIIRFQGRTLRWGTSNDSKALCHRCGKLGCAPTSCPLNQRRGRSLQLINGKIKSLFDRWYLTSQIYSNEDIEEDQENYFTSSLSNYINIKVRSKWNKQKIQENGFSGNDDIIIEENIKLQAGDVIEIEGKKDNDDDIENEKWFACI
ncbi:hypothetical protein RhiirC2_788949 [Rhizophagus irregularis]|uniref:Uncharacterized protein n=1 Tax=Rhizophagus irregularis TaxID=588596 RepID=A0A2N1MP36_9GLOM|nr:hypothetical protein RhiirC2_788949 [Rhizophagus irregularis]